MIKPLEDRVLIKIEKQEERNEAGLIIPDTVREREQEGLVMAVGPGRLQNGEYVPLHIKPGDKVFFGKTAGTEIKDGTETYYLFGANQIQAILED